MTAGTFANFPLVELSFSRHTVDASLSPRRPGIDSSCFPAHCGLLIDFVTGIGLEVSLLSTATGRRVLAPFPASRGRFPFF